MINYYLINGKNGKGKSLNLLSNGEIKSTFEDISILDLASLDINFSEKEEILKEYNNDLYEKGFYYDLSFPHKKTESHAYAPIFNYGNETKTKEYLEKLKYFAEQRKYKIENNEKISIDNNSKLDSFIRSAMGYVLRNNYKAFLEYNSLIAAKTKDLIKTKVEQKYYMGTDNYISANLYVLRSIFSSYTQIRNLVLEIIREESRLRIINRSDIGKVSKWDHELSSEAKHNSEYAQLTLFDVYPDIMKKDDIKKLQYK